MTGGEPGLFLHGGVLFFYDILSFLMCLGSMISTAMYLWERAFTACWELRGIVYITYLRLSKITVEIDRDVSDK